MATSWKPPAAAFEISIGGVPRTMRDREKVACAAARELERTSMGAKVVVTDLRTGEPVPHHEAP